MSLNPFGEFMEEKKHTDSFRVVGITETTILNGDGKVVFDAADPELTGIPDHQEAKRITALFASAPSILEENKRLKELIRKWSGILNRLYPVDEATINQLRTDLLKQLES